MQARGGSDSGGMIVIFLIKRDIDMILNHILL